MSLRLAPAPWARVAAPWPGTVLNPLSGEFQRPQLGGPGNSGRVCARPPLPTPVVRPNIRVSDAAGPYSCGILVPEAA